LCVVGKGLGARALSADLGGIALSALAMGFSLDAALAVLDIDIVVQMATASETVPEALKLASGLVLAPFFAFSLYKEAKNRLLR